MQQRVIAILFAHSRAETFQATLNSIRAQSRPVDRIVLVDSAASENSSTDSGPIENVDLVLRLDTSTSLTKALHRVVDTLVAEKSFQPLYANSKENVWLWVLPERSIAKPRALFELLSRAEIAPSADLVGPMLLEPGTDQIAELGETITKHGASLAQVQGELNQGQHDDLEDVLGVGLEGSLIRLEQWEKLSGFDPGLPSIDASLDFSIRTRLSGRRVVVAPRAKISTAGGPEGFLGGKVTPGKSFRIARSAQLHRRLVYSALLAVPLHWLSFLPIAVFRSISDLLTKFPDRISGEFLAAIDAMFRPGVLKARRNLRKKQTANWESISPLRVSARELRARRVLDQGELEDAEEAEVAGLAKARFFGGGGIWVVVLLAVAGLVSFGALLGAQSVLGGALQPLSDSIQRLWSNVGYGWRDLGTGMVGAADPFTLLLAIAGSLTFWNPSSAVLFGYLIALPLAGLGGWFLTRRIVDRPKLPILGAILWGLAPPFLVALFDGRIGAVIAHLLLPWLIYNGLRSARSWGSAATTALLLAATVAAAPVLAGALAVLTIGLWIIHPLSLHRTGWIPLPTVVLFGPLIFQQIVEANPLGLLADPAVPVSASKPINWLLTLADPGGLVQSWSTLLGRLGNFAGLGAIPAWLVVVILLGPMLVGIVFAAIVPNSKRSFFGLGVAALGFVTAVASTLIQTSANGPDPVTIWPGAGLSLYWLGLSLALIIGISKFGPLRAVSAVVIGIAICVLAVPQLGAMLLGNAKVSASDGRTMPALVVAQASSEPNAGTLVITALQDGNIQARLERGVGERLDDQSTLVSTKRNLTKADLQIQNLAGNLSVPSGYQAGNDFAQLNIEFVLVPDSSSDNETHRVLVDALNGNEVLSPVGHTKFGSLWQFTGEREKSISSLSHTQHNLRIGYFWVLGIVFGCTLLLAIPTGKSRRYKVRSQSSLETELEEDND